MQRNKIKCQKRYMGFAVLSLVLLAAILLQLWGISVKAADTVNPGQPTPGSTEGTNPGQSDPGNPQQPSQGSAEGTNPGQPDQGNSQQPSQGSTGQTNPAQPGQTGTQEVRPTPILTQFSGQGRNVTLTINLAANSQVSSGRLKIRYPKDLLVLSSTQSGNLWRIEDLNTGLEETGQKVIAYAWADTENKTNTGTILTLNLEAQDAASGREITVETEIVELFSQQDRIIPQNDKIVDRLRTDFTVTPSQAGGSVRTGDNTNVAGYVLLCLGSVLVMVGLVRSKVEY